MIQVRIRKHDEAHSVPLCEIALDRLDWLMAEIPRWGLFIDKSDETGSHDGDLTGQFVLGDDGAYFEIIAHDKEKTMLVFGGLDADLPDS